MSERLGFDVERNMKHLKEIVNKDNSLTLSSRFVKYLIEQAELVDELERKVRVDSELFDKQVKQNKRYREALEYIADNKIEHGWHLKAVNCVVRARKALEGEE